MRQPLIVGCASRKALAWMLVLEPGLLIIELAPVDAITPRPVAPHYVSALTHEALDDAVELCTLSRTPNVGLSRAVPTVAVRKP